MKKLLLVFAISAFFVACNNATTTDATTDSATVTEPVTTPAPTDSMSMMSTDSTKMMTDSTEQ